MEVCGKLVLKLGMCRGIAIQKTAACTAKRLVRRAEPLEPCAADARIPSYRHVIV